MTTYVQRQVSAFLGNGTETDPVRYGIAQRAWSSQDVYPAKILKISDGQYEHQEIQLGAVSSFNLTLPGSYNSTTMRLFFMMKCNVDVQVFVVGGQSGTGVVLVRAGANQRGIYACDDRIILLQLLNPTASVATIQYSMSVLPDLTLASSWRDGNQTTGVSGP